MPLRKSRSSAVEKALSPEEQQAKINEVRRMIGPLSEALPDFCSDASISRYLRSRNWNAEKASKMLKETVKWRLKYKPEAIRWEDVAHEAATGKIYRADYSDKYGRSVLVMRPGFQKEGKLSSTESAVRKAEDVVSSMLAKGFVLSKDALKRAMSFDERHYFMSSAMALVLWRISLELLGNHHPLLPLQVKLQSCTRVKTF
ncbi:uncharacterized protein LOC120105193 [Phoenix dactylifera]|uniref:Uncharacterized protein LOC120105193 n=1 Tax=Phoenix dactylifera TaxID=42345 RepID=A0A8B8ZGT9_PHODC|nr:uncharacterized protein LOC120105193 [Phoenix dactylifera]XP_038973363.1 uncharacterized protein LOC120105193 [Phoenix dactylifera]XP_038973364.1 uncharacterized protein LOC120105193 [Phoenix dactylifera]XP_038973365.1 uncharacterized protein LOC120105193 [Phoenix dactylifera]